MASESPPEAEEQKPESATPAEGGQSSDAPAPEESLESGQAGGEAPADDESALDAELPPEAQKPLSNTDGIDQTPQESKNKPSVKKAIHGKKNMYMIGFGVLVLIAGGLTVFSFMQSQKKPPVATIGSQTLSQEALSQLANADSSVGSSSQTLTVQSNATFAGQVLVRGGLTVATNIQAGGTIQASALTISGAANLGTAQINTLQVAQNTTVQGTTTLKDLSVAGAATFSGPVQASQITVTKLILSGNASLQVPNHISFTGNSPGRVVNTAVLGAGGSASISGSDTAGTVNISTGSGPVAGCFLQITFNQPFGSTPRVIVSPYGSAAGNLDYYVTKTTTGFNLCTNNAAAAGSTFGFDYFVTN
jgi:cytoskeletal protein CcmA (bactofilin family)